MCTNIRCSILGRIVLGTWSDTPPLTYEHGGCVVNAAILIDGKRPIGARARRIADFKLVLNLSTSSDASNEPLNIEFLDQLSDYSQPYAPGALLKAVCCITHCFPDVQYFLGVLLR